MSNKFEWKKIGEAGVDSGLLMVADPCYFVGVNEYTGEKDHDAWVKFLEAQENPVNSQGSLYRAMPNCWPFPRGRCFGSW